MPNHKLVICCCRSLVLSLPHISYPALPKAVTMAVVISGRLLFFVILFVRPEQKQELAAVITEVATLLNTGVPGVNILHATKKSGEPTFYAVTDVGNISDTELFTTSLSEVGNVDLTFIPITDGNDYARDLGLPDNITISNSSLNNERLYLQVTTIRQGEKTVEETQFVITQQFEEWFTLRQAGELKIVVYKEFQNDKFYTLINIPDPGAYDLQQKSSPLFLWHAAHVSNSVEGVQPVSNFLLSAEAP